VTPLRRALFLLGAACVGVLLVGSALLGALEGFEKAGQRLEMLSPGWLMLALLLWSSSAILQGFRWKALIPDSRAPSPLRLGWVLFGSNVLNIAMPGPVGELGAAGFLKSRYQVPLAVGLVSTLIARLWALVVFAIVVLLLWPVVGAGLSKELSDWLKPVVLLLGAILVPAGVLIGYPDQSLKFAQRGLVFFKIERGRSALEWWLQCFAEVGKLGIKRHLQAVLWAILNTLLLGAAGYMCFRAVGVEGELVGIVFLQALTALTSVLAILLPSGLGAVDAMFIVAFATAAPQAGPGDAVACAMVVRLVQLCSLAAGLPAMLSLLK
jgi:uncharacterized protein (TIRG00374 family)